jgi:hypothetical protein
LEERHVNKKNEALELYATQKFIDRAYFGPDYIVSLAKTRGVQINSKFAEAFEIIRWVYV